MSAGPLIRGSVLAVETEGAGHSAGPCGEGGGCDVTRGAYKELRLVLPEVTN